MTLSLPNAADFDYPFNLQVVAGTKVIGSIRVTIPQGQTAATLVYRRNDGAQQIPDGTQELTNGRFWLGCTTPKGYLRGNAGHTSVQSARVWLRVGSDHSRTSASHTIRCTP